LQVDVTRACWFNPTFVGRFEDPDVLRKLFSYAGLSAVDLENVIHQHGNSGNKNMSGSVGEDREPLYSVEEAAALASEGLFGADFELFGYDAHDPPSL
jgi:hypothetical protein